ncbi:MAG: hypothetical protein AABY49_13880 [Planctomycetota bacterium]
MRFGEYLIKKGKVEESELEDALKFQREEHITLGVLAIRENALNNEQLSTILDYQREKGGGLFGKIAIDLGFLSKKVVDKLLILQKKKHNLIGEILVLYGAIGKEEMEEELRQFHEAAGRKK